MWPVLRAEICHTEVTENGLHSYMLRQCSHQFVWPRRATDGRYYQVCRICEAEYEYDWESMQRLQSENLQGENMRGTRGTQVEGNGKAETATATATVPEIVVRTLNAQPRGGPRLRLLLESEPAHRIFLRNLTDLVLSRTPPPIATTSAPAPFWSDVFVPSSVPWWWFVESLLGHMILVTAVLILVSEVAGVAPHSAQGLRQIFRQLLRFSEVLPGAGESRVAGRGAAV